MRLLPVLLALPFAATMPAQQAAPAKPPVVHSPPAAFLEPKVNADRTVTFHYTNASATAVSLSLEGLDDPLPLTKGAAGVWTLTTAPLAPEIYSYHFVVDGRFALDPRNILVKDSLLSPANEVIVPGAAPMPWEPTDVPHGEIHHHFFTSKIVTGLERDQDDFFVYTPPGYDAKSPKAYPVLYLLHGYTFTASSWTEAGRVNFILDGLIASGKAKPMIVVMPLGYGAMSFIRAGFGEWEKPKVVDNNTALFEQTLLTEIKPRVEQMYRISPRREDHAIAGLSMGGLEALTVGLTNTGEFAWVGGFSSAVHLLGQNGIPGVNAQTAHLKLLWIACGTSDSLIEPNRRLIRELKTAGFPVTAVETPGLHTWLVWRDNLVHFAPLLFQDK